jgi:hypothetical protein
MQMFAFVHFLNEKGKPNLNIFSESVSPNDAGVEIFPLMILQSQMSSGGFHHESEFIQWNKARARCIVVRLIILRIVP